MATRHWLGGAPAVAQVDTGSIVSHDAASTYTVTIGGIAISEVGDTDVATTATNLRASLNASTHPYFAAITWSGTSGDIIGTADVAGASFSAALTVSGGTGTVTDFAATTANSGPYSFQVAANWDSATSPVNGDTIIFSAGGINCVDGLATGLTGITLIQDQSFTGWIGMARDRFATSADGATTTLAAPEYRNHALSGQFVSVQLGRRTAGNPAGSTRVKIDNTLTTGTPVLIVHNTASTAADGKAAVHYHVSNTSCDIKVRTSPGGVAINADVPGRTASINDVDVVLPGAILDIGPDTTVGGTMTQVNGVVRSQQIGTATQVFLRGGTFICDGTPTITQMDHTAGSFFPNGALTVTTMNLDGGVVEGGHSAAVRTFTTMNYTRGTFQSHPKFVIGTLNFTDLTRRNVLT